jgi:hypothetical protein
VRRIRCLRAPAIRISITVVLLYALGAAAMASSLESIAPPSLTPAALTVLPGGTLTFTLADGPANRFDWVGLFCPASNGDAGYIDWKYLSNTKTAPAVGLAAATVTMTAPSTVGMSCDARLFANDTSTKLATSATVTVTVTPTLTMAPVAVAPGGTLTIVLAGGAANRFDWIGLFCPASNNDSGYIDWKYLSNSKTAPAVGLAAATITMTAPTTAGTACNARLFAGDTGAKLVTSGAVTVTPTATLTMAPLVVAPGGTLTVVIAGGPANPFDWVGLYCPAGSGDTAYVDWKYLSNSRTAPPVGLAAATITMAAPTVAGTTCEARLFANHTYAKFATSPAATVADDPPTDLVAAYSYNDGAGTTAADGSVNNNTGDVVATPWSSACKFGNCLSFNGSSSFVESADIAALTLSTEATFEAWVSLSAAPSETVSIFNKWNQTAADEYLVGVTPARALYFAWQTTGGGSWPSPSFNETASTSTIPLDTLTHIAVVRNGVTLTFYINGTPNPPLTVLDTSPFRNGANTLRVGAQGRGGRNRFFPGVIDEARIYSRALTQAEIQADMNTPIGPDTTPPVLSAITVSGLTSSVATIEWTTNESSDTQVEWGTTAAYGNLTPLNGSPVTDHSVTLAALTPTTLYHYRARSRDAAGNLVVSGDHTFTTPAVDLTPPAVSITAPAAAATVSGVVAVTATATDNVAVTRVQFKLDGADLGFADLTAPYTINWDTGAASEGAHTLTAVAWDAAGNQRTSTAVVVTVVRAVVQLAWDANAEADLAGYKVYVGLAPGNYFTSIDVGNVTNYTVTGLEAGRLYYFAVTAYDQDGNESSHSNEVSTTP